MDVYALLAAHLDASREPHRKARPELDWSYDRDFRGPLVRLAAAAVFVVAVMLGSSWMGNSPDAAHVAAITPEALPRQ